MDLPTWHEFFDSADDVSVDSRNTTFRVYTKRFRHFSSNVTTATDDDDAKTLMVFHHGAGMTGLSFSCIVRHMHALMEKYFEDRKDAVLVEFLCIDARGHGHSKPLVSSGSDEDERLDLTTVQDDLKAVIEERYGDSLPKYDVIFLGHSLGASVVANLSLKLLTEHQWRNIVGLVVLDLVEGSAVEAMVQGTMKRVIQKRPTWFQSPQDAIEWCYNNVYMTSGMGAESARISVPDQLRQCRSDVDGDSSDGYVWRTDLLKTEPYWTTWFQSFSDTFLKIPCAKLLLLPTPERLDKPLTIAQIQGKFQMNVIRNVGHLVHEDGWQESGNVIFEFWKRCSAIGVPPEVRRKLRRR